MEKEDEETMRGEGEGAIEGRLYNETVTPHVMCHSDQDKLSIDNSTAATLRVGSIRINMRSFKSLAAMRQISVTEFARDATELGFYRRQHSLKGGECFPSS